LAKYKRSRQNGEKPGHRTGESLRVLISEVRLHRRVKQLAREIRRDFPKSELHLVGVLKGFFKNLFHMSRLKFVIDFALLAAFTLEMMSGLLISRNVLPALGINVAEGSSWRMIHRTIADSLVFLAARVDHPIRNFRSTGTNNPKKAAGNKLYFPHILVSNLIIIDQIKK